MASDTLPIARSRLTPDFAQAAPALHVRSSGVSAAIQVAGLVRGAVVDDDHLERRPILREGATHRLEHEVGTVVKSELPRLRQTLIVASSSHFTYTCGKRLTPKTCPEPTSKLAAQLRNR